MREGFFPLLLFFSPPPTLVSFVLERWIFVKRGLTCLNTLIFIACPVHTLCHIFFPFSLSEVVNRGTRGKKGWIGRETRSLGYQDGGGRKIV